MTNVYVVRYGCYSDQGIACVFSSKEEAQRYCDLKNQLEQFYDDYWIDEYVLDEYKVDPSTRVILYYSVCISLTDGYNIKAGDFYMEDEEKDVYTLPVIINKEDDFIEVRSTESFDHARKVAIEQYQIYTQQKLENGEL